MAGLERLGVPDKGRVEYGDSVVSGLMLRISGNYSALDCPILFSASLLLVWLLAFCVFDRLVVWRVCPGQLVDERLIGGQARSYDTDGLVFERRGQDLFLDIILGRGAADVTLTIGGADEATIHTERSVREEKGESNRAVDISKTGSGPRQSSLAGT